MDEREIDDTRVWLGWCELSRSDPGVAATVAHVRAEERELLAILTGRALDETGLDAVVATTEGLAVAVCAGEDALSPTRARQAILRHLDGALRSAS